MADVSKFKNSVTGEEQDIKDAVAREEITELNKTLTESLNGLRVQYGTLNSGGSTLTFSAQFALIATFGSYPSLVGFRSNVASKIVANDTLEYSADGTTYTVTNNSSNVGTRYFLFMSKT